MNNLVLAPGRRYDGIGDKTTASSSAKADASGAVSIAAGAKREEAMGAFLYSHARGSDGGIQNALAFDEACVGAVKALCQDLRNMKEHGRAVAK